MFDGYKEVEFEEGKRIIVISDIHGDYSTFVNLLKKCEYQEGEDYLIVLGDIFEKGNEILKSLHYVMELSKKPRVYVLKGNCDRVMEYCNNAKGLEEALSYNRRMKKTLFNEKARELGFVIETEDDLNEVLDNLEEEAAFIDSLPLVLVSSRLVFVHAGIKTLDEPQDPKLLLAKKYFAYDSHNLKQYVICGHYPVSNYCSKMFKMNPYFDMSKKIISIDGGNNVKSFGQLNALIIENYESGLTFTYRSATHFPRKLIKINQKGNESEAKIITWPNYEVKLLSESENECLVLNNNSDYLKIKPAFLKEAVGKWQVVDDYTNYVHEINRPVIADIIYEDDQDYLANIDGVIGWINK